jgi:hypothetical protein
MYNNKSGCISALGQFGNNVYVLIHFSKENAISRRVLNDVIEAICEEADEVKGSADTVLVFRGSILTNLLIPWAQGL